MWGGKVLRSRISQRFSCEQMRKLCSHFPENSCPVSELWLTKHLQWEVGQSISSTSLLLTYFHKPMADCKGQLTEGFQHVLLVCLHEQICFSFNTNSLNVTHLFFLHFRRPTLLVFMSWFFVLQAYWSVKLITITHTYFIPYMLWMR